nr:MAG TPA: hypothetical protein [Caudoviricetes sp.]
MLLTLRIIVAWVTFVNNFYKNLLLMLRYSVIMMLKSRKGIKIYERKS